MHNGVPRAHVRASERLPERAADLVTCIPKQSASDELVSLSAALRHTLPEMFTHAGLLKQPGTRLLCAPH